MELAMWPVALQALDSGYTKSRYRGGPCGGIGRRAVFRWRSE